MFTFSRNPDPLPAGGQPFIPPEYYQLLDPTETTANVLNDWLVLNITSTFHTENEAEGQPLNGITFAEDDGTIRTCLGADDIYPLLVQGYTTDERLVFSFRVATTLVHEIAVSLAGSLVMLELVNTSQHAVTYAHRNWMHSPGPSTLPIISGHPAVENSIASIGKLLFAHQRTPEPFFEQEQRCEVGFSLENHVRRLPSDSFHSFVNNLEALWRYCLAFDRPEFTCPPQTSVLYSLRPHFVPLAAGVAPRPSRRRRNPQRPQRRDPQNPDSRLEPVRDIHISSPGTPLLHRRVVDHRDPALWICRDAPQHGHAHQDPSAP